MTFDLRGTPAQNALVQRALDRCSFPFMLLADQLRSEAGRETIPVEWDDLSRYVERTEQEWTASGWSTVGVQDGHAHGVGFRARVLGLFWYSGRIQLDLSLEQQPDLAAEVFLAEAAHAVDVFYMSGTQRVAVYNAFHVDRPDQQLKDADDVPDGADQGHGHGWFDVGGYYSWCGEAFMVAFTRAYSDVTVSMAFDHGVDDRVTRAVRQALTPPYFGSVGSPVFHDAHKRRTRDLEWSTYRAAVSAGRRPCGVCRPQP